MVTIAGVQFAGNADKETNIQTAIRMVREAADRGARIICLPELFSTMYFCVETRRGYFDWAEPIPGPTIDRMSDVARETATVVIAPIFERAPDGRYFNSATVIGPDGHLIGKYRKSSIPLMDTAQSTEPRGNEKFYFTPGDLGFPTSRRRSRALASSSAMTGTSPRGRACWGSAARRSCSCPPPRPA